MPKHWITRGKEVIAIEIEGLEFLKESLNDSFSQAVELLGACTGRVIVTGIGKSGLVGKKISATFSSTGTPSFFMHPVEGAHGDLGVVRPEDVVLAISNSGKNSELNSILPTLKSLGTQIIAMTAGANSPMVQFADIFLNCSIPKEACPHDLAPTTSTTAALALGDALAVCLMDLKNFTAKDFKKYHPAGALGQRLRLTIEQIMHKENIPLVGPASPMQEVLKTLDSSRLGAVVVLDTQKKILGIITDGDIRRMLCQNQNLFEKHASDIMTKKPLTCVEGQSAALVIDTMEQKSITFLPVIDEHEELIGVVHLHDILGKGSLKFAG